MSRRKKTLILFSGIAVLLLLLVVCFSPKGKPDKQNDKADHKNELMTGEKENNGDEQNGTASLFDEYETSMEQELNTWAVQKNGAAINETPEGKEGIHLGRETHFAFKDVEGTWYKAPLLRGVPECTYDFTYMKNDEATGYKRYEDSEGNRKATLGIDVSEFQGEEIDWQQVKQSGIDFVMIRLGYRAYGESGKLVLDAMFENNIQGASAAGLKIGVYFFSQAISAAEAVEEAEFVLEHLKGYAIDGPIAFDTEEIKFDTARTDENTRQEFTNYCKIFCDTIEHAGYDTLIYSNMKWMTFTLDMEQLKDYEFWYADYSEIPQCPYEYKMWQYSDKGSVPGIKGNVDLNLLFQEDEKDEVE